MTNMNGHFCEINVSPEFSTQNPTPDARSLIVGNDRRIMGRVADAADLSREQRQSIPGLEASNRLAMFEMHVWL
jgi:hypothetical protein